MALDLIPVRFTIKPTQMTLPNIGYKANSIYERDAIFDELEKMGWAVERHGERGDHLFICAHESGTKFWASNYVGGKDSPPLSPSPESFLAAAREALKQPEKPKYPTETLHAKCSSSFELRGCIRALHEAGVKIHKRSISGKDDTEFPNIGWSKDYGVIQVKNPGLCGEKVLFLSEFMDIFLKPEPKREVSYGTPPEIKGRTYRVVDSGNGNFEIGEIVTIVRADGDGYPFVVKKDSGQKLCIGLHRLELLPEEPKRETPPKIVGRKYRAIEANSDQDRLVGDICELIKDDGTGCPFFKNLRTGEEHYMQMIFLELLPEEPWTAEYAKGQDVWAKATVRKVREGCLDVSVFGSRFCSTIHSPSIIKKA